MPPHHWSPAHAALLQCQAFILLTSGAVW
jgi:hypothetical protein